MSLYVPIIEGVCWFRMMSLRPKTFVLLDIFLPLVDKDYVLIVLNLFLIPFPIRSLISASDGLFKNAGTPQSSLSIPNFSYSKSLIEVKVY